MEQLFGDNLIIIYFIVGLGVICYSNFNTQQRIMLMYTITYVCCLLNILDAKVALIMMTLLLFIYLEYLTEDYYNFLSLEFAKYRILRFRTYIKHYHGKEKIKRVMYAAEHYAAITKFIIIDSIIKNTYYGYILGW